MNNDIVERAEAFKNKNCSTCKLGDKKIGPRSGCEIRKKLVVDLNKVAWKNIHLFVKDGKCKMWQAADNG